MYVMGRVNSLNNRITLFPLADCVTVTYRVKICVLRWQETSKLILFPPFFSRSFSYLIMSMSHRCHTKRINSLWILKHLLLRCFRCIFFGFFCNLSSLFLSHISCDASINHHLYTWLFWQLHSYKDNIYYAMCLCVRLLTRLSESMLLFTTHCLEIHWSFYYITCYTILKKDSIIMNFDSYLI